MENLITVDPVTQDDVVKIDKFIATLPGDNDWKKYQGTQDTLAQYFVPMFSLEFQDMCISAVKSKFKSLQINADIR